MPNHPVPATNRTHSLFQSVLGRRPRPPRHRGFNWLEDVKPPLTRLALGGFSGERVLEKVCEGDITVDNISAHSRLNLESRHGSITIVGKVEPWVCANLKAAGSVTISNGIECHSIVQIVAGGYVTIGQARHDNAQVMSERAAGDINSRSTDNDCHALRPGAASPLQLGDALEQHSSARITAHGDVTIGGSLNRYATADIISLHGAIVIERAVREGAVGRFTGKTVRIGEKIGQYAQISVLAQGDVSIGWKIEQYAAADITSLDGSIHLGQGVSANAIATLIASCGRVNVGEEVA